MSEDTATATELSHDKQIQRAELIQVLAEALVDGVIRTTYLPKGSSTFTDLTEPGNLEQAFDNMVDSDEAYEWHHFRVIIALPAVIKLYRRLI